MSAEIRTFLRGLLSLSDDDLVMIMSRAKQDAEPVLGPVPNCPQETGYRHHRWESSESYMKMKKDDAEADDAEADDAEADDAEAEKKSQKADTQEVITPKKKNGVTSSCSDSTPWPRDTMSVGSF